MKLWLVRHAVLPIAAGTCYGRTDMPADDAATQRAAAELAAQLAQGIALRSSPLQRCEQLANALCELRPDLHCDRDARLAELDFGAWEGQSWQAIGEPAVTAWTNNFWLHAPGGGETLKSLMARVGQLWDEAITADRDCAWITHDGVIRAAGLIAQGRRDALEASDWPLQSQAFGSWKVLEAR